jgi:hypothetical protein
MRFLPSATLVAAGLILYAATFTPAQAGTHQQMGMMYDAQHETTINGTVEEVNKPAQCGMMGTHLVVKSADKTTDVMLGPANYLAEKGFSFAKGDNVQITGSNATACGTESFIAREVVKDGKTLTLRDKTGRPSWAGMMRRGSTN